MTVWLLIFGVVAGAALLCELAINMAAELFGTSDRESAIKEEISKLNHDLTQADKRIASLKASTRAANGEIEAARQEVLRLEHEMTKRKTVPPILVYRIGPPSPTQLRYRAPLAKRLPPEPEPHQALVWRTPCFIETWAHSPRHAAQQASQQFRTELGYAVGAFVRRDEPA